MLKPGEIPQPEGAAIPEGATRLPDGNFQLPDNAPVLPAGTMKLPSIEGSPAQYMDGDGNLLDGHGNVVDSVDNAPTDVVDRGTSGSPASGADVPRVDSPVREPALVGTATHTADNAGQATRLGDSLDNNLGDVGRVGEDVPTTPAVHAGGDVPTAHAGGELPGGTAGDQLPGGSAGDHLPGGSADHLPGGRADDLGQGPSASHESPSGHTSDRPDGLGGSDHDGASGVGRDDQSAGGEHDRTAGNNEQSSGGTNGFDPNSLDGAGGVPESGIPRANEPLPEMTPEERAAHGEGLEKVEQRNAEEFDALQRDPDKNGGISEPSKDEARVGLDLRDQGRLPDDIQRPAEANRGEFHSPSTGNYYDIKGVHSEWPPFNNARDKSRPFPGAYDPANNGGWVKKLETQIEKKGRIVILDVRNANQAAIDDIKSLVEKNGWEDNVIWYP
ncbi:hypothetical protein CLM62_25050 [Streptomyces sp. SA15]|uniref:hypothetical protein n=1 Tax=Streptomyces sp. SA15 TaxID=934019 RepID=UPI000BB0619D|nr:hypothetical protein [Streptomyces sp. SA15]PAZ13178.1 hypothetical protein CLM62_25050 [Streptomyces sp. SA15]